MTDGGILVVCTANVCRSPMAALVLRAGLGPTVAVSSAGIRAEEGAAICALVASRRGEPGWGAEAEEHRARRVTPEMVEGAGLVLAASREIRGELVRLAPRARARTFTMKEAARLGAGFTPGGDDLLTEYVGHLNGARVRVPPRPAPTAARRLRAFLMGVASRGGPSVALSEDPADIADRHGLGGHGETLDEVESAVADILAQLGWLPGSAV